MTPYEQFKRECSQEIAELRADRELAVATRAWMDRANARKYSYHFEYLGRPIIQYPQDTVAVQELIWSVRPDLIFETGIAHGGSLILSASMLALLDMSDAIESGETFDPKKAKRRVLAVDIDIRAHNRAAIEAHPMSHRIDMIEGSSTAPEVIERVHATAADFGKVLVCLDSNHTHEHVLAELRAYAPLVSKGSYCVVMDTVIEDLPEEAFPDRPWGRGDNPKTAVKQYLKENGDFVIDHDIDGKTLITVAPDGYLKRIR